MATQRRSQGNSERQIQTSTGIDACLAQDDGGENVAEIGCGQGIYYPLERWPALMLVIEEGRIEMDNNAANARRVRLPRGARTFWSDEGG
jgi:hypothetical protein